MPREHHLLSARWRTCWYRRPQNDSRDPVTAEALVGVDRRVAAETESLKNINKLDE